MRLGTTLFRHQTSLLAFFVGSSVVVGRLGPGFKSVNDDTMDKRNVVQDSLEDETEAEDDDIESKHLYGDIDETELHFI